MCKKTSKVAFISRQIKTTPKSQIISIIGNSPLKMQDCNLMIDVLNGLSYKELAQKYNKSEARIYQWKRTVFERLFEYQVAQCKENH